MKMYRTKNLWDLFLKECPVISTIPGVRMWAFGHFTRGYFEAKLPEGRDT